MTGQNVLYPGDALTVWIDARSGRPAECRRPPLSKFDQADLTATFKTLKSGLKPAETWATTAMLALLHVGAAPRRR